jgi:hypothetical protein
VKQGMAITMSWWLAFLASGTIPATVYAAPAQQAYLKGSNTGQGDRFGGSVSLSGDTAIVGAPLEASNATGVNGDQSDNSTQQAGAAYIFVRNGTNWTQQAYLKASNTGTYDSFGRSVAVSGDTAIVGAHIESSSATGVNGEQTNNSAAGAGAAYIFVRSGTNWSQQAYLKASNTGREDVFGCAVAMSHETVVVGAAGESSSATGVNGDQTDNRAVISGAAYVFVRNGTNWSQQAYLKASNTGAVDHFGTSVAVSGDTIVIGAFGEASNATGVNGNQDDNSAREAGAAYVFVRSGTNWTQQAYLKASNTELMDQFGVSVALSGDTVVVGARFERSSAAGINGNQSDNSAIYSGAAYIFVRNGTNWSQQAYLKASNPEGSDNFGSTVAVSDDTVVISAQNEDSGATGVNGDQLNNDVADSGAAYVFVRSGTNWNQEAYLKASDSAPYDHFGYSLGLSGGTLLIGIFTGGLGPHDSGAGYLFTDLGPGPQLKLLAEHSGGYFITFIGKPDVAYNLQRASDVVGPWDTLTTLTAPLSGLIEFHDVSPLPGQAFYRLLRH